VGDVVKLVSVDGPNMIVAGSGNVAGEVVCWWATTDHDVNSASIPEAVLVKSEGGEEPSRGKPVGRG
jgi:uncharacterized protein YodC (DUF2158 family)